MHPSNLFESKSCFFTIMLTAEAVCDYFIRFQVLTWNPFDLQLCISYCTFGICLTRKPPTLMEIISHSVIFSSIYLHLASVCLIVLLLAWYLRKPWTWAEEGSSPETSPILFLQRCCLTPSYSSFVSILWKTWSTITIVFWGLTLCVLIFLL